MTDPALDAAAPPRRRALGLSTIVGLVIGVVACAFVVRTLGTEWDRVSDAIADASVGWLAVGLVAAALAMTSIAWNWTDVLALLGARAARGRVVGLVLRRRARQVPPRRGLAGGRPGRAGPPGRRRPRPGLRQRRLSLVTLYLAAMFVAVVLLPFSVAGGGELGAEALLLLLLPVGLVRCTRRC